MSITITEAQVRMYADNVLLLSQQKGSKLRKAVREKPASGKYRFFERLAPTAAVKRTSRHSPTPLVNSQHSRRRAELVDYEWADLVDKQDEIRILIDPKGDYAVNGAYAMGRSFDDEIIAAFTANAFEGEDGGTTVAFPTTGGSFGTGQVIAHGSAGFSTNKLIQAMQMLDDADVDDDEDKFCVVSPRAIAQLLSETEVGSSDYNAVKPLVTGDIAKWMGFTFIKSTRLPKVGNVRDCFAWVKRAMGLGIGKDIMTRMSERPDLSYAMQVYLCGTVGAVRIEDVGVIKIEVDESVALS